MNRSSSRSCRFLLTVLLALAIAPAFSARADPDTDSLRRAKKIEKRLERQPRTIERKRVRALRRQRAGRTSADLARNADTDRDLVRWIRAAGIREWQSVMPRSSADRLSPSEISDRAQAAEDSDVALPESLDAASGVLATDEGHDGVTETTVPINGASERFYIREFGAVGDGITDDTMAIQAAVDAATAAGGGTVVAECGKYRIGPPTGSFYSGIQVTGDNITIESESPLCAEWLPGQRGGGVILAVCPGFINTPTRGADQDCENPALDGLENVVVRGIYFHDDDPQNHCGGYGVGGPGNCIGEESHAVLMSGVTNGVIESNLFEAFGDETISLKSPGGTIRDNVCVNTPGIPYSSGACINLDGTNLSVTNNIIMGMRDDPSGDCPQCISNGAGIRLETASGTETGNILIDGNQLYEIEGWYGVVVDSSQARIHDVSITRNRIDMEFENGASCNLSGSACQFVGQTNCTADITCAVAVSGATGDPVAREEITIGGNTIRGGIEVVPSGGVGAINLSDNQIVGRFGRGLQAAGSPLEIRQNRIEGFEQEGVYLTGLNEDGIGTSMVSVTDNTLISNNMGSVPGGAIGMFTPSIDPCGPDGIVAGSVLIDGNLIQGPAGASNMKTGVGLAPCVRPVVTDNVIDFNGSSALGGAGIRSAAIVRGNQILDAPSYGVHWSMAGVIVSDNVIERAGDRSIYGQGADSATAIGNMLIDSGGFAIDITGDSPICMGNNSRNTANNVDRLFYCGDAAPGVLSGCGIDQDAGGVCQFNQFCNASDPDC